MYILGVSKIVIIIVTNTVNCINLGKLLEPQLLFSELGIILFLM